MGTKKNDPGTIPGPPTRSITLFLNCLNYGLQFIYNETIFFITLHSQ